MTVLPINSDPTLRTIGDRMRYVKALEGLERAILFRVQKHNDPIVIDALMHRLSFVEKERAAEWVLINNLAVTEETEAA